MVNRAHRVSPLLVASVVGTLLVGCRQVREQVSDMVRWRLQSPSTRYLTEGDRLAEQGRKAEAILAYRQAVEKNPNSALAVRRLSSAYAAQGRRRLARRYVERAILAHPADQDLAQLLEELSPPAVSGPGIRSAWERLVADGIPTGMAVDGGRVYVAYEDRVLAGLSAADGSQSWQASLPGTVAGSPTAGTGLVLVGDEAGTLHAYDGQTGTPRWRLGTGGPIHAAPLVTPDTVYCASGDGALYVVATANGNPRWRFATEGALRAPPAVVDGTLYLGSNDTRLYALDALTGASRWAHPVPTQGSIECQPTVAQGRLYVGSGDSRLYCLDPKTGGEYWRYSTADAVYARPVVVGDTVYLASSGQTLTALGVLTGTLRWEVNARGALIHPPAVRGQVVYWVANGDPHLYATDARTGHELWRHDTGDWPACGPVISGDRLFLVTRDGTALAYDLTS